MAFTVLSPNGGRKAETRVSSELQAFKRAARVVVWKQSVFIARSVRQTVRLRLVLLVLAVFALEAVCVAQQTFEVRHLAGSPGGLGSADGVGAAARFQSPREVWGDGTYLYVSDNSGTAIRSVTIATGDVRLAAGSLASSGFADGPGDAARFSNIRGLWGDGTYLYIADCSNGRVRRMTLATADVVTIAGSGRGAPVDGPALQSVFRCPLGIWGNDRFLYVTDSGDFPIRQAPIYGTLRKIDLVTHSVSTVTTPLDLLYPEKLAGDRRELFISPGNQIYAMDLQTESFRLAAKPPAPSGIIGTLGGMWAGGDGFLYLSRGDEVVRINIASQELQSLFGFSGSRDWIDGIGSQARLRGPAGIWGDGSRLYIADRENHVVRAADLSRLEMTTLAGIGVHIADQAQTQAPSGVSWSDGTYLYFGTPLTIGVPNQIWKMPVSGGPSTVLAGSGPSGSADGPGNLAQFNFITGIWGDGSFLYVIDGSGDRLRKVSLGTGEVSTVVSAPGLRLFSTTVSRNISGDGTNLFVAGSTNILKVNPVTGSMENVAGIPGTPGADDGIGQNARFQASSGLWNDGRYLYIADNGNGLIRRMSLATYEVTTLAGRPGVRGIVDGIGRDAAFSWPNGIWGDGTNLYITDDHTVRKLSLATNEVRTIAGSLDRVPGLIDGVGTQARFFSLRAIWGVRNVLYVEDEGRVRTVDPGTGEVETIAGRPAVIADGLGMNARFNLPTGIWGDSSYLYVTDRSNHVLRRMDRRTGEVKTVAGIAGEFGVRDAVGDKARFNNPTALCSDGTALYVADSGNSTIRKVTIGTWKVETIAGTPRVPGKPETSHFISPAGLWCDKDNIYVTDVGSISRIAIATGKITVLVSGVSGNSPLWSNGRFLYFSDRGLKKLNLSTLEVSAVNSIQLPEAGNVWGDGRYLYVMSPFAIKRLDLSTEELSSVAGSDSLFGTEDGIAAAARFQRPFGLWSDGSTLYVADTYNHAIRTITLPPPPPPPPTTTSVSFAVPVSGSFSRTARDSGGPLAIGYARVQAEGNSTAPSGIAIYGFRSNGVLVSETSVPAVVPIRSGRIYAETAPTVRTGLAIANPNSQSVSISFYFTDASGQNFGIGTMTLDAHQQTAAFLDEQPFYLSSLFQRPASDGRTFTFSASQPVAAIALRGFVNERSEFLMTTLPIADLSRATPDTVVVPHFAEGGGWATQLALVNPSDQNMAGTIQFFDQSGNSLQTQSYDIAARSSIVIRRNSSDATIRVGSIHITSSPGLQTPVGISIFSYNVSGVTVTQTGVPTTAPASLLRVYGENSASLRSGFAFANATSRSVAVNYEVLSKDGASIGVSGSLEIPANGQRSMFLNELPGAQALPAEFKGVLRVTTSGSISAMGIRGRTNERGEFLVSTTMPDQGSDDSSAELYIPHFAQGGGYTTEFILIGRSTAAQANTGSIQFYSQSGQALTLTVE